MGYIFPEPIDHLFGMLFLYFAYKKIQTVKSVPGIVLSWVITTAVYYFAIIIPVILVLHVIRGDILIIDYLSTYLNTSYMLIYEWLLTSIFSIIYFLMIKNYFATKKMIFMDVATGLPNGLKLEKNLANLSADTSFDRPLALIGIRVKDYERLVQTNGFEYANTEFSNVMKQIVSFHQEWYSQKYSGDFKPIQEGYYRLNESLLIFAVEMNQELHNPKETLISNYCEFKKLYLSKLSHHYEEGIIFFPDDSSSLNQLTSILINLLYTIYNDECIRIFDSNRFMKFLREEKLRSIFETAIEQNEFYFVYQPKIRIKDSEISGYEALARWKISEMGFISPVEFIPVAEKYNFIELLTKKLISEIYRFCIEFKKSRKIDVRVSINLSVSLLNINFLESLFLDILSYDLNNNIEFEITESMISEISPIIRQKLQDFRSSGINISIDDFGTGYSNLHYLLNLNANVIKIDKSFIDGILTADKNTTLLVELITNIGKSLNMEVVAEGVEEASQVEFLNKIGCDIIQGYYYSKQLDYKDAINYQVK